MAVLRSKLLTSSPDKAELESRLRELTESLIQKQTTLETLNSERHSLNLQMQRMQVCTDVMIKSFFPSMNVHVHVPVVYGNCAAVFCSTCTCTAHA